MNDRLPADVLLARALVAHVPAGAPAGLRGRITSAVEVAPQRRGLPAVIAPLFDADPVGRHRSLLVAAALLVALLLAGVATAGALLETRKPDLSLAPPEDLPGYLDATYRALASLPAFELVGLETGDEHHVYADGHGAIRDERPSTAVTRIVTPAHEVQLSVDPAGARTLIDLGRPFDVPGLEIGRLMGADRLSSDPACRERPIYLRVEAVLGRPTHRIRCGTGEYWIDIGTRLILRARTVPATEAGGVPAADPSAASDPSWEVVELRLGPQPDALFSDAPPDGYLVVRADDPACLTVWFASCRGPMTAGATPWPYVSPPPASAGPPPVDIAALAAEVREAYAEVPALELVIERSNHVTGAPTIDLQPTRDRHWADGTGRFRTELSDGTTYITTGPHIWISYDLGGQAYWLDNTGAFADHGGVADIMLDFPEACPTGWRTVGVDVVMGRPATHVGCGGGEFWIDREWRLVLRSELHPADPLERNVDVAEVVDLRFAPQPAALFDLPPGARVGAP